MLPFGRFYGFESWLDHESRHGPSSLIEAMELDGGRSKSERKSTEACKSHREAERRRRQRINAHLSTLRSLLPNAAKSDKASLLAEVVQHVKRLRTEVDDVVRRRQDGDSSSSSSSSALGGEGGSVRSAVESVTWPFPGESDEATLSYCDGDDGEPRRMKATLCCEDRPGLNRDLTQAIRSVRAKAVRAEMMTVGGRTKSVVVIQWPDGGGGGGDARNEEVVGALERALKAVIENRALVGSVVGRVLLGQKRARDCDNSPSSEVVDCAYLLRSENYC